MPTTVSYKHYCIRVSLSVGLYKIIWVDSIGGERVFESEPWVALMFRSEAERRCQKVD